MWREVEKMRGEKGFERIIFIFILSDLMDRINACSTPLTVDEQVGRKREGGREGK